MHGSRPEKKVRCPSWCDRVLYSVGMQSGDSVKRLGLDRYWSSGPLVSDHMPGEKCVPCRAVQNGKSFSFFSVRWNVFLQMFKDGVYTSIFDFTCCYSPSPR